MSILSRALQNFVKKTFLVVPALIPSCLERLTPRCNCSARSLSKGLGYAMCFPITYWKTLSYKNWKLSSPSMKAWSDSYGFSKASTAIDHYLSKVGPSIVH